MRILGSGTPRLKRDLGYGYRVCVSIDVDMRFEENSERSWGSSQRDGGSKARWVIPQCRPSHCLSDGTSEGITYLILAVAVATSGTTSHDRSGDVLIYTSCERYGMLKRGSGGLAVEVEVTVL